MPEKDPLNWTMGTWLLASAFAISGGVVNWYARVKSGNARVFNFVELFGEIFTSGVVGLGAFMALDAWDQPLGLCAAAAGISGHMGTRLLFAIERAAERKINAWSGGKESSQSEADA